MIGVSLLKPIVVKWALISATLQGVLLIDAAAQQTPALPKADAAPEAQSPASASGESPSSSRPIPAGQTEASQRMSKTKDNDEAADNSPIQTRGTSNDVLPVALPNFLTLENAGEVLPLSTAEKFEAVTRGSFDYVKFFWYGAIAGIRQARTSQEAYGQGATGYGKRYGAAFADGTIESYMTGAVFPAILHQDPRCFQLGKGGFWGRAGHALRCMVITRTDSGHSQFNYSEVIGSGAAAGISTFSYYPRNDRSASTVMTLWGAQAGYDALILVLKEFWPDIRRKVHKSQ